MCCYILTKEYQSPLFVCVSECFALTTVFSEPLVAELSETLKALVKVTHFLLQVFVLLVQHMLFDITLQRGDYILVDLCRGVQIEKKKEELERMR